jgi:hypothetical protein
MKRENLERVEESAASPKPRTEIICRVAGHPEPIVRIYPGRVMCGHITDGISIANGEKAAGYVLAFSDLERAYLAAKKFREDNPLNAEEKKMASLLIRARAED